MSGKNGLFIVIEGSDGAGKGTQFKLLAERLKAVGHDIAVYDFPRYEEPSSYFVKRYLNGEYGPAADISPYTASLFYALDRYEAAPQIRQSLSSGKIVLANRYVGSNMAHQGAKFTNNAEQRGFFMWEDSLEFQLLGIPRPTINVFLRVQAEISYELIKSKATRSYTDNTHDEHEADMKHLRLAVAAYQNLCRLFPKDFKVIDCVKKGKMLPIPVINNLIWDTVTPLLPKPAHNGRPAVVNLADNRSKPKAKKAAKESTSGEKPILLKDISLLAAGNLQTGAKVDLEKTLHWPSPAAKARLDYYIPSQLKPGLSKKYGAVMDELASLQNRMRKQIQRAGGKPAGRDMSALAMKYIAAAVPLAALCDVKVSAEKEDLDSIKAHINRSGLPELAIAAKSLGKYTGEHREHTGTPQPEALKNVIRQLAETRASSPPPEEDITLLESWPKNEFSLLVDYIYPLSSVSRDEIAAELDRWPYAQKAAAIKEAGKTADAVTEKAYYRFDMVTDRDTMENFSRHYTVNDVQVQPATPRYGYEVPETLETFSVENEFIRCFDLSLELFSEIQAAGLELLAPYAVLAGHKLRWQVEINAKNLFSRKTSLDKRTRILARVLQEKAAEAHPIVSSNLAKTVAEAPRKDGKLNSPSFRKSNNQGGRKSK